MIRLTIVCEGQTEVEFCRVVLAPYLSGFNIYVAATRLGHSGGGDVRWSKLSTQLHRHLQSDPSAFLSTLFDYYGRSSPHEWPGAVATSQGLTVRQQVRMLEEGMTQEVDIHNNGRFIPYLQLHEFEALLFSDPAAVSRVLDGDTETLEQALCNVVREHKEPELINSRRDKTPSRRLAAISPGYAKGLFGALLAEEIGLARMRTECPGFNRWVKQLEALGK